ncbi:MAG TPA: AbrB/MazE/SpoVT family DNA-binding domain-containing protein [Candidatus Lokiarchaeia archaeon]|nr:AbrB/MazE/SpoVT family DNA-binding domain-containing protein [Candidatus Lokiarchaeia archaeon]
MTLEKFVKVANKGMVTIPAAIRKKYGIIDGHKVLVVDDADQGAIVIYPVESVEMLRDRSITVEEFRELYKQMRQEDLELDE